jgi:2-keto-4-pentenoate hydratase/2-oxohepta-3-ene-1,7-dioic acid hydratase in catechol pathway
VDFEGELALIVGRDCRDVPEHDALSVLAGYAAANDVTARWWQREGGGGQFCRGKGFDTFCPIGAMVPASAVRDPQSLRVVTRLNGTVMQDSSTSLMLHPVARIIAELSRGTTLLAGTVILTGTPAGVGFGRNPKVFMQAGDVVEVEIEGVGHVRNPVKHA